MTITRDDLGELLDRICHDEPPVHDGVEAVFRRAEAIRRRRMWTVVAAGVSAVVLVAAVGYVLATAVVPAPAQRSAAAPAAAPAPRADPALLAVRAAVDDRLRVVPREPSRGAGWRQYTVLDRASGRPHGLVEISVYAAPARFCFPVLADAGACARPERSGDAEYVRYSDDRDVDWQVHQVIARWRPDGRVVAVLATGERGTGDRTAGRPPLTASQAAALAANPGLRAAFGADERCNGPDPACPLLKVPVRAD
ncbi:MAG TPA: hypothetical protein VFH03_13245 [Actinoplanes sp.]|nr:hypothetical protein [Actinoplanes sp.]